MRFSLAFGSFIGAKRNDNGLVCCLYDGFYSSEKFLIGFFLWFKSQHTHTQSTINTIKPWAPSWIHSLFICTTLGGTFPKVPHYSPLVYTLDGKTNGFLLLLLSSFLKFWFFFEPASNRKYKWHDEFVWNRCRISLKVKWIR